MQNFFRGLIAAAVIALPAGTLAQECEGQNILEARPAEYLARLDEAADKQPFPTGRFFQVSRGEASSILFGTIHLPDPDVAIIPPRLEMEIRRADRVFIELTEFEEQRMQRELMTTPALIRNSEGRRISDLLSGGEMEALAMALSSRGLTPPVFDRLEPWFLNLMVAMPKCVAVQQAKGEPILDRLIEASARRAEIPVEGLEAYDDVLGILSGGDYEDQVAYLMMSLPLLEHAPDAMEVTKQLYLAGDIVKIWEFSRMEAERLYDSDEVDEIFSESYEQLVTVRNRNWMDTLLPALDDGGAVVAVGALHLGGTSGLLAMLENEGFEVSAISE
ncbi:TraB/GumN family protein [Algicella marina]|uniref:TraB/GumN family protein n=1 Tax=Algicella marina TaxID=2683284 RepID=A0A6P1T2K2_9RHOB|nr:TraB/GumN family protein [Algicella marina]QHQ35893.1 hypothetical protein GO499_12265 [Algicella marina]